MRRLRSLMRRGAGPEHGRGGRLVGIDRGADRRGMLGRQQPLQRIGHKGRVAEHAVAVDIGVPHRLGHPGHGDRRAEPRGRQIPTRQHVEHLAQDRATGTRRRRR